MEQLREFYNIMIEYPWCTLFTFLGLLALLSEFSLVKIYNVTYKDKEKQ